MVGSLQIIQYHVRKVVPGSQCPDSPVVLLNVRRRYVHSSSAYPNLVLNSHQMDTDIFRPMVRKLLYGKTLFRIALSTVCAPVERLAFRVDFSLVNLHAEMTNIAAQ